MLSALTAYTSLFLAAFLAATILPAQSELGLVALLLSDAYSLTALVIIASIGNSLGAVVTWAMGRFFSHFHTKKWFPIRPQIMAKITKWYQRFGKWSLLLSWAPVIGDAFCCMAGVFRLPLLPFIVIVSFAKTTRYIVVAALTLGISG